MLRLRPLAVLLSLALALCLLGLWSVRSQTGALRRVTNTSDEGLNLNPSLSGDGHRIAFESTEDLAHAGGSDRFRAIRADLTSDPVTFVQMGMARSPAPGISQDGSIIAFAAKENPLGTNNDGNSEIFLFNGATLWQITNTTPNDISSRVRDGNFQPSLSDDGRFIAFSSNRNLANQNGDGNLEIFIFDTASDTFTQLTSTAGAAGATDAKISGDGSRVAYIRNVNALPAMQRDLMLQDRAGGTTRILASNVTNLALTYGRAISDDGLRVVYSGDIAPDSSQVFLFDGRTTNATRQITVLGARATDVPLHPTISGDGTRIAFATRRPIAAIGGNSDNSIELYTYDIPTGQFDRVTNATSSLADGFNGSNRVTEVVSSLNDDGSIVAFNFPRALSGTVGAGLENNSEIYVTGTAARPTTGSLTILNEASFGHEPSTTKAVAPESRAVALGGALSFNDIQTRPDANGNYPTTVDGTTVTVNGRSAQIFFVSPTQVNFLVPAQTELGTATVVVTNAEGFQSRGTVSVMRAAPGIYTESGDGLGKANALNADTGTAEPFDPSNGNLRLVILTTGVRKATQVTVTAGGRALTFESVMNSPDMPGMDEIRVLVPSDLRGAGTVNLVVRADGRDSNPATITFSGNGCRDLVINEVLADPPGSATTDLEGDANHDNTRSGSDDEFVELVNTTAINKDISGYQLLTRSSTATSDTVRFTFPSGTIFPAGSAIVIFGGGTIDATKPVFGGAQVFKASSSSGLALSNDGGVVTLREPSLAIASIFSYGDSVGLDGGANQSLTRSPDAGAGADCGNFKLHSTAEGSIGNFSPGTRVNGTPFAPGLARLASITISPPSASVAIGQTTQFTAQARDQFNRALTNTTITFASDDTNVATVDSVTVDPATGIATANVTGHNQGIAHITAQAINGTTTVTSSPATLTVSATGPTYTVTGQVRDSGNNPLSGVLITFDLNSGGTLATQTTQTDANGNYASGDLGCQNNVKVTPTKAGFTFTPSAIAFTSTRCLSGSNVANFTGAPPPPGTLVISQIYVGGGNSGATYRNDFVEIFNSGTTTVDFSVTPYSIQFAGTGVSFGSTSTFSKTNITSGTIAPGQYFLVYEASSGAVGAALPAADATGTINLLSASGKVALVVGTTALPASSCPGDDGASPFIPSNPAIADFVGYGGNANTVGHCYEGPGPAAAPGSTNADFRKAGGCVDTNFNTDDFLVAAVSPRNTGSPLNNCSAGLKPEITINDPSVAESTANATFTVTLSTPSTLTVTVDYATANSTATAGADYQSTSGTLTFAPGETTKSVLVPIINDTIDEASETFFVNLTNASNSVILDNQGQGTITDNDAAPAISINDVSVTEGDGGTASATFNVTLSAASGQQVTAAYATADGSATAGTDYQATSGTITFNPGQTTQTITVLVNGDTTFESNETFFVNLTVPINATILDGVGQGTITNDDAAPAIPAITIDDVSIAEGDSGTKTVNFTVSLSMNPTATVTVDYATADGTATAGSDYQSASGTLTFNTGETAKTITVTINGDILVEPHETFFVNLSNATNAFIADDKGQGTINNDDTANLVISQVYGGGGNAGSFYKHDFIELFNRGNAPVDISGWSVQYRSPTTTTGNWSVTNLCGSTTPGTCVLQPGQYYLVQQAAGTSATGGTEEIAEDIADNIDLGAGGGKVALVNSTTNLGTTTCPIPSANVVDFVGYGNANCFEGGGAAPATTATSADFRLSGGCKDTDFNTGDFFAYAPNPRNTSSPLNNCSGGNKPDIVIDNVTVTEGSTTATFTVALIASPTSTVTVDFATANGTATAGADYQSTSGTLTFAPGETSKTIPVTITNDTTDEPNETFFVNLSNASGGTIADPQGLGTITDNDAQPTISINDTSVTEGDGAAVDATFNVSLSQASGFTVTVNYATADGSATAGSDYQATSGTVTFNPGQTTQPVTVPVNGDTTFESNETFVVKLTTPTNATILDGEGQGTITNDDAAPPVPAITIDDVVITEGDSSQKTVDFTVSLSMNPTTPVTVDYATANGTATAGSDYLSTSGTLTFNTGETSKPVTITINGDILVEPNETFFVNLSNASANSLITDFQGQGTITNDDGSANLVISQVYGGGGNGGAQFTNDFIEIFNHGTTTVDVAGWSVQYQSAAGTTAFQVTPLCPTGSCLIQPGKYFLVQEAAGATSSAPLPTPQATGTIVMAAGAGRVALLNNATPIPANATCAQQLAASADFVGYGTTATCFEGSGPAPAPSATTADFRKSGGCVDTNNNAADFETPPSSPNPRNSSSPANTCAAPALSINDATVAESAGTATFTVSLNTTSGKTITVNYATADNTAIAPGDYTSNSGTLTFAPGDLTKTINVAINDDALNEATENFSVTLSGATGATIADNQGVGTITDNDTTLPSLSINDVSTTEGDNGTKTLDFTVTLTPASGQTVTVNYATSSASPATATAGTDYQATSGTLTFNPGDPLTQIISVTINGDTVVEPDETFFVDLSGATHATISKAQGVGTITNDDIEADLSITKTDSPDPVSAGENITYTLTVTNNSSTTAAESVAVSDAIPANTTLVSVGAAPSGWTRTDLTANGSSTGPITFSKTASLAANGTATFTITVKVNSDSTLNNSSISNTATVNSTTRDDTPGNNSATATTTVRTPADLSITKTVSNATPNVDDNVTFTITVSNAGPFPATSVTVLDQLPSGLTYVSHTASSGTSYDKDTGVWTIGTLAVSGSATLTITATATSSTITQVTNTASIQTSDQFDPNTANNSDSAAVRALNADLSLTKDVDNATPNVNDTIVFTIALSNGGPDDAPNVQVADQLPSGLAFVSYTATAGTTYDETSGVWDVGTLAASTTATLTITATVQSTGNFTNTAEVTQSGVFDKDSTPNNHDGTEDDQASKLIAAGFGTSDLSLAKTVDNETPNVNQNVVFTIKLSNAGPDAATNVQVTDKLPTGLQYVTSTPSGGTTYDDATGIWDIGNVATGTDVATLTITAKVLTAGAKTNTATVTQVDQSDPNTANDSSSATVTPLQANLTITKSDSPDPVLPGGTLTYTIVVTNNGPDAAQSVTVTDDLPSPALTFSSCTSVSGNGTCGGTGNNRTITFTSIANGASETITIEAIVSNSAADGSTISNTATVASATTFDPSTPNSSTTDTTVHTLADLVVGKSAAATVLAGNNLTYTITLSNAGGLSAQTVSLTDTLPTNTTFVSLTQTLGTTMSCSTPNAGSGGTVTCTLATMAGNTSVSFSLVVKVDASTASGTIIANSATATTTSTQSSTGNDTSAVVNTTVGTQADLSLSKVASTSTPVVGQNMTFTVTLTNGGPSVARSVQVTDLLPSSSLTFVSETHSQGSYNSSTGVWTVGDVGSSATLTITATVKALGSITNKAEVTASGTTDPDSTPNNNNALEDDQSSVTITASLPLLVISQLYTGGGAASATYNTDFIEIFNHGTVPINLSGFSVQYADATVGNFTVIVSLPNVTLQPRQYYLITAGTSNAAVGVPLPVTPDQAQTTPTTNMTASAGKVAIVFGMTPLTSSNVNNPPLTVGNPTPGCPTNQSIVVDFVGYGTTASCFEGTARALAPSNNTQSIQRLNGGCTDTNDNLADFARTPVAPRNSSTTKASCP
ncbi:MAG: large repetitive protein [Acidobacteriota bacterium]|nr:large repetitive protein [Acidobacteriota bacterium]